MTDPDADDRTDHVLILGYGDLTEPMVDELSGTDFVVVTPDGRSAAVRRERGIDVVQGDPSEEGPLLEAGIERARSVVAATNDDAADALAILTARYLAPDARIIGAATDRENVGKLRRAGADTVISPALIGSHLLVQSALGRADMEELAGRILDADIGEG